MELAFIALVLVINASVDYRHATPLYALIATKGTLLILPPNNASEIHDY